MSVKTEASDLYVLDTYIFHTKSFNEKAETSPIHYDPDRLT